MPARRTQKSPGRKKARKKVRKKTTRRRSSRAGRGAGLRRLVRRAAWVLALVAFGAGFFIARSAVRMASMRCMVVCLQWLPVRPVQTVISTTSVCPAMAIRRP